jgi:hypothetical protein
VIATCHCATTASVALLAAMMSDFVETVISNARTVTCVRAIKACRVGSEGWHGSLDLQHL